jgi:hypothetical protein
MTRTEAIEQALQTLIHAIDSGVREFNVNWYGIKIARAALAMPADEPDLTAAYMAGYARGKEHASPQPENKND